MTPDHFTDVRIVSFGLMSLDDLLVHPLNPRRHHAPQRDALDLALNRLGWLAPLLQSARTGQLLDGHLRLEAAQAAGLEEVPVCVVDLSPEEEALALAVYDPLTSLAQYDGATTALLVASLPPTDTALVDLLYRLAPPPPMPGYDMMCPECGYTWEAN